jgi:hypothetical protein
VPHHHQHEWRELLVVVSEDFGRSYADQSEDVDGATYQAKVGRSNHEVTERDSYHAFEECVSNLGGHSPNNSSNLSTKRFSVFDDMSEVSERSQTHSHDFS